MNNNPCEWLLDYFNGQLDEVPRRKFENHLAECQSCREELDELAMLTKDLAYTVTPVDPPSDMKQRILGNVFETEKQEQQPAVQQTSEKRKGNSWVKPLLAAVLFASLLGNAYTLLSKDEAENNAGENRETIDRLQTSVALKPGEGAPFNGKATMIEKNDKTEMIIQTENLEPPQGSQVYQVWLLEKGKPYRAGTFVPNGDGQGAVTYHLDEAGEHEWDTIAITLEPSGDSKIPKGDIILSSEL
ncbi:anti-sigma factor [Peribacillus sp. SI8-4]|uniref:anti-sigma factor n=1 Tax=Peribacillus sp. SI8-4 TaxID=3048009 RepID=UPI0025533BBF|nr:anti-sigma factor [Peribacillus sp. SI8-4]